jgi:hypothetical protein
MQGCIQKSFSVDGTIALSADNPWGIGGLNPVFAVGLFATHHRVGGRRIEVQVREKGLRREYWWRSRLDPDDRSK